MKFLPRAVEIQGLLQKVQNILHGACLPLSFFPVTEEITQMWTVAMLLCLCMYPNNIFLIKQFPLIITGLVEQLSQRTSHPGDQGASLQYVNKATPERQLVFDIAEQKRILNWHQPAHTTWLKTERTKKCQAQPICLCLQLERACSSGEARKLRKTSD